MDSVLKNSNPKKSSARAGQATFEYIFLLTFAIVATVAILQNIVPRIDESLLKFGASFEKNLKTGRAPAGAIWSN
ncbi:MAG: hypothetical protein AB7P04_09265 [Bacteriovoracia bacterium]